MENKKIYKLDMSKISKKKTVFNTTQEALKDVTPINWSEEVLSGKKKVIVTNFK